MKNLHLKLLTAVLVVLASGCASFQAGKLPEISDEQFKLQSQEKTKLFSRWSFKSTNGMLNETASAAIHKESFEAAVIESGCCDIVEGPESADVVVDASLLDDSTSAALIPAMITGFSLYTIPSWVTEKIDLTVKAKKDSMEKSYKLDDSVTLVQWLPMILAFPFTGTPKSNSEYLRSNTYKSLIVEMGEDGYFK